MAIESTVIPFPIGHVRTSSSGSRAARAAKRSAVSPALLATEDSKIGSHHSAGIRSRCAHLRTADVPAWISAAIASGDDHKAMTERNEVQAAFIESPIGQSVLKRKAKVSRDIRGHNVLAFVMPNEAKSAYRRNFIARTRRARESTGFSQERLAGLLEDGMKQDKYAKYEIRTCLPPEYIDRFCVICNIDIYWFITGQGQMRRADIEILPPERIEKREKTG